jgi:hypothetical protein
VVGRAGEEEVAEEMEMEKVAGDAGVTRGDLKGGGEMER